MLALAAAIITRIGHAVLQYLLTSIARCRSVGIHLEPKRYPLHPLITQSHVNHTKRNTWKENKNKQKHTHTHTHTHTHRKQKVMYAYPEDRLPIPEIPTAQ